MTRPKEGGVADLRDRIEALGGFTEVAKEDIQREYARINRLVQATGNRLEKEGIVVEREVGTVNNRHMAKVENEMLAPYKKLCGMLTGAAKTLDMLKRSPQTAEDVDEFSDF